MIGAVDRRDHCASARCRPRRRETTLIVMHRTINVDADNDGDRDFDDVIRFFTQDPEGVATVAIGGKYTSKIETINRWRRLGIPAAYQGAGFVPYHLLIDSKGGTAQTLELDAVGAHAGSWANARGVAVAVVADPRTETPTTLMLAAAVGVIAQLLVLYPQAQVVDHDWVNRRQGYEEKGCIGSLFPLRDIVVAAIAKRDGQR